MSDVPFERKDGGTSNEDALKKCLADQLRWHMVKQNPRNPDLPYKRDKDLRVKRERICRGTEDHLYSLKELAKVADLLNIKFVFPDASDLLRRESMKLANAA